MANFPDHERAYLLEMRALATDEQGRDVLVGLTHEETEAYLDYARSRLRGNHNPACSGEDYLRLHEKHEIARLAVLGAETEKRVGDPPIH